jgi:hypothetical protein
MFNNMSVSTLISIGIAIAFFGFLIFSSIKVYIFRKNLKMKDVDKKIYKRGN